MGRTFPDLRQAWLGSPTGGSGRSNTHKGSRSVRFQSLPHEGQPHQPGGCLRHRRGVHRRGDGVRRRHNHAAHRGDRRQAQLLRAEFTVHHSQFPIGLFLNAVLSFLIIASVVYWLVVAPTVALTARLTKKADATTKDCPECLSTIPIAASRCMYCTVELPTTTTAPAPATVTPRHPPRRHRGAPGGTAQATKQYQWVTRCQQGTSKTENVRTRAGAWPSRVQTFCTATSVRPLCFSVWHRFLLGS